MINKFNMIKFFLEKNQSFAPRINKCEFGSEIYWAELLKKFLIGREFKKPMVPSTRSDVVVKIVLKNYFKIEDKFLDKIGNEHKLCMASENMVGDLLERYIAKNVEKHSWIWCSGSVVKSIDFLCVDCDVIQPLQIKNRDNSENSSSSKIREGTEISKWFRSFSRKEGDNWVNFPSNDIFRMSEEGFVTFCETYLNENA